jgi:putative transposase
LKIEDLDPFLAERKVSRATRNLYRYCLHRKRILKGKVKGFVEKSIFDIQEYHPDVEIERYSIQNDHVHLIIIIPPKCRVSRIIGKIKANTSRELKDRIEEVRKIYCGNEFWSPGFYSSAVGINEEVIKRYVEFQEKLDKGQVQLNFGFQVPWA